MKSFSKYLGICFFLFHFSMEAQSVFGKWKTVDDETGKTKAIIKIFEKEGKVHAIIEELYKEGENERRCSACKGPKKNLPFKGFPIIEGLEKKDGEYVNGFITNPENGKSYDCKIWLDQDNPNFLKVRGYVSFLYRTETWERL